MNGRIFQFEWDVVKASANARKHSVSFELARTVFNDPRLLTVADLEHSENDERWFSVGCATGARFFRWSTSGTMPINRNEIRLISARHATQTEIQHYRRLMNNEQSGQRHVGRDRFQQGVQPSPYPFRCKVLACCLHRGRCGSFSPAKRAAGGGLSGS